MLGGQWFDYSFNEEKYNRLSAAFLGVLLLMVCFAGGYFSGQTQWWWTSFFVFFVFKWVWDWLGGPPVNVKTYDHWLRVGVCVPVSLIFFLIWLLGFWMSKFGLWWMVLFFIPTYALFNKYLTKRHK